MTLLAFLASLVLIATAGILRAAGAALLRTPRADALRDSAEGDSRAAIVADLLEDRAQIQPALSVVHTVLLVPAAALATWALSRMTDGMSLALSLVGLLAVFVLVGDLVPRAVGRRYARAVAYRFARLLRRAIDLGSRAADLIEDAEEEEEGPTDIHADQEAADDERERALIDSVLEFSDTIVREVMTPRTDMVTIEGTATTDEALDLVLESGRSRIPVTGAGSDDIIGVLYARDLLQMFDREEGPKKVSEIMRPAYFVPETKRVSDLLREMQNDQVHLAIVVDEYGGTAGLVTIEDLLEEIVGEIADEYDTAEQLIVPLEKGGYLVDARLGIDELEDLIGIEVPDEQWDTVGGLVLGLAGRVPKPGESFEYDGHTFTADRIQGRRVAKVKVDAP